MLSTIDCQVNLCVAKIFGLIIGEQQYSTVAHALALVASMPTLVLVFYEIFIELDACHYFAWFSHLCAAEAFREVLCRVACLLRLLHQF